MMKATLDTSLIESCDSGTQDSPRFVFVKWLSKLQRVLSASIDSAKRVDNFVVNDGQSKRVKNNRIMKLLIKEYRKACFLDQSAKDDFFFRCNERRKNIPKRIWDRHGAFLLYSQQLQKQNSSQLSLKKQPGKAKAETFAEPEYRVSFQVCSVKPLPVWSTATYEMSCIECDISSLRLLEIPEIKPETAQAA